MGDDTDHEWYAEQQARKLAGLIARLKRDETAYLVAMQDHAASLLQVILADHDALLDALRRDVEERQTVLVMLQ